MHSDKLKKHARTEDLEFDSSPLCCCEYNNTKGERTHIVALLCNCQELDESVERCLRGDKVNANHIDAIGSTCTDRIRFPWFGGAKKIEMDIVLPVVIIPSSLYVATWNSISTILVFVYLPYCLIIGYTLFLRRKNRTGFFHYWAWVSLLWAYGVYIYYVVPVTSPFKNIFLVFSSAAMFFFYFKLRFTSIDKYTPVDSLGSGSDRSSSSECKYCGKLQALRMQHCRICNVCVPRRDHHCVWVDACIGAYNHREFIMSVILYLVNCAWILCTTFPEVCSFNWSYPSCGQAYSSKRSSTLFVLMWYGLLSSLGMVAALVYQLILISCNMTGGEIRSLPRGVNCFQGLKANPYNKGFFRNWRNFLLMDPQYDVLDKHSVFET